MAIKKPEELNFDEKKFSMIIYGSPGTGKTTLALSAPNPVLFDFDHGISRVKAEHRKDTSVCRTYEEVLSDIRSADMRDYDTVIIDHAKQELDQSKKEYLKAKETVSAYEEILHFYERASANKYEF